jgi:hypothetical protein
MVLSAVEDRRMMAFRDVMPRCEDRDRRSGRLRGHRHHRPGRDDHIRRSGTCGRAAISCRGSLPFELGSVGPNAVHDRRDLACNRHLGFLRTNSLRELEPPTLER